MPNNSPYDETKDIEDDTMLQFFKYVDYELDTTINKNILNKQNSLFKLYEYKKYKSINYIFLVIILVCFVIIGLTIINKNISYFDNNFYMISVSLLLVFSIVYIGYLIFDVYTRNNINYDEYDFNTKNNKKQISNDNKKNNYSTFDISGVDLKNCIMPNI